MPGCPIELMGDVLPAAVAVPFFFWLLSGGIVVSPSPPLGQSFFLSRLWFCFVTPHSDFHGDDYGAGLSRPIESGEKWVLTARFLCFEHPSCCVVLALQAKRFNGQ